MAFMGNDTKNISQRVQKIVESNFKKPLNAQSLQAASKKQG